MEINDNFNERDFEKEFSKAYDKEKNKFEEIKKSKLIISLLGDVNVGKSETMNALTGTKLAKVSAKAGETVVVAAHPYSENVYIADTPGLDDINEEVSKKAINFVHDDADVIILFFNAAVGAAKSIINTYKKIKTLNKPIILVLNKIDIWYDGKVFDREAHDTVVNQIESETGQTVVSISAKKNINIKQLNNRIIEVLEECGKDIFFLKISKYKEEQVKTWINGAAVTAFGLGLIPLPGADMIPLTSLQVGLALKIAYIYDCKVSKSDVMALIASTVTGGVGKKLFRLGVEALKGVGFLGGPLGEGAAAALAGVIAASITYGFGWACNTYYKSGMQMDLGELGEIYKEKYNEYYSSAHLENEEVAATKEGFNLKNIFVKKKQ